MKNDRTALEKYRRDIARCVRCGSCSTVCPSFLADRRESRSPRGRMALIEAVLDGKLRVSDVYKDRLATCAGCLACESACASGVPFSRIILAAREQAVHESGPGIVAGVVSAALQNPLLMRSLAWLAPVALHYGKGAVKGAGKLRHGDTGTRGRGDEGGGKGKTDSGKGTRVRSAGRHDPHSCPSPLEGEGKRERGLFQRGVRSENKSRTIKGRVAFFAGCAVENFQQDIGSSTVAVLEALGYEVVQPAGLVCCGRPFFSLGDRSAAEELARKNHDLLASLDVDAVVTSCASCGLTFKKDYPALLAPSGREPVRVQDIHEFLAGKTGALELTGMTMKVTWHDPCHLGRGQGLSKTGREVLLAVPGIELVEMKHPDRCCGFGGVMRLSHPSHSSAIGEAKAKDIAETQADVVIAGCPGCRMQIADGLRRVGSETQVVHTVQVIEAALRSGRHGDGETRGRGDTGTRGRGNSRG